MAGPQPASDKNVRDSIFAALSTVSHDLQHRRAAKAPLPTSRQLTEERRKRFFRRIDGDRETRQFAQRAEDMMRSAHRKEQQEWEDEMAQAAASVEEHISDEDLPGEGLPDIPADIETAEALDSDDLAAITAWTQELPSGDQDIMVEEHFGSDDDSEEFGQLLDQVAQQYEQWSQDDEAMDLT